MAQVYKVPLVLVPQPEGGYTVTSPVLPELVTEGDTLDEVLEHAADPDGGPMSASDMRRGYAAARARNCGTSASTSQSL